MDQRIVVGVGNIYASEALFRAGIRPRRAAGRVKRAEWARLVTAIREVLAEAITQGGTTLRDYVERRRHPGLFQPAALCLRTEGRALPALRDADPAPRAGPALHLFLPVLPEMRRLAATSAAGYDLRPCTRNCGSPLCGAPQRAAIIRRHVSHSSSMRILLGVTGGIAAYKSAELTRRLKDRDADVQVVMTAGAQQFVAPLTFQALSGRPVRTDLWDPRPKPRWGTSNSRAGRTGS